VCSFNEELPELARSDTSTPIGDGLKQLQHLVGIRDLRADDIHGLLELAAKCREEPQSVRSALDGKTVALLFMEPSTRTRFSFEMAATSLGAKTMVFQADASSSTKGESLMDTVRTLRAIGVDAFVIRHRRVGAPHRVAERLSIPVLNAGDGINEHPTQALLDALTLRDHLGTLEGRTIGIVGDVRHSRVARSNCFLLTRLGATVIMCGPGTLCPSDMEALGVEVRHRVEDVVKEVDALMMLRIQRERLGKAMLPSDREYAQIYGLDEARLHMARASTLVMHPAPMNRGVEIADTVADGQSSVVFQQVQNGVAVRMACLLTLMREQS